MPKYDRLILCTLVVLAFVQLSIPYPVDSPDSIDSFILGQDLPYVSFPNTDDIRDDRFRLVPCSDCSCFDGEYIYESVATNGNPICLYGNFQLDNPNLWVEFFFIDQKGFEEYETCTGTSRKYLSENYYSDHSWNEILPAEYEGEEVTTWYVVLSVVGVWHLDPIREGSYLIAQDKTGPSIAIDVDDVVSGTTTIGITLREYNVELRWLRVWIDSRLVRDIPITEQRFTTEITFVTTEFEDGPCIIAVRAWDTGWANNYVTRDCYINNTILTSTQPSSPTISPPVWFNWSIWVENFLEQPEIGFTVLILNLIQILIAVVKIKREAETERWLWVLGVLIMLSFFFVGFAIGGNAIVISLIVSGMGVFLTGYEVFVKKYRDDSKRIMIARRDKEFQRMQEKQLESDKKQTLMKREIDELKQIIKEKEKAPERKDESKNATS